MDERDMNDKPTPMLPNEVLLKIMQYLDEARSLLRVGGVCRQWRLVSEQNILWKPLCKYVTALTQEQRETSSQLGGYKALYVGWRQKWCSADETQCEDIQLEYKVLRGGDSAKFRGWCLAVTDKYILGCSEQNKDKLLVWSSSGIGEELVDISVPQRPGVFVTCCVVSSDEKCVVLVTNQSHIAQLIDIASGLKVRELSHPEQIDKIWIHKNYLIVNIRKSIYMHYVWDIDTGVQLYQWPGVSSLPAADVVCDGNLALVCHMQLDPSRAPSNPGSPLLEMYDLTTGGNILREYLVPSPASTTIALSESRSMFACIYDHGFVSVHDFGQQIFKRDIVGRASHICFHGDYLLVSCKLELLIFELSKIRPYVLGDVVRAGRLHSRGSGCVGVIQSPILNSLVHPSDPGSKVPDLQLQLLGPSVMHGCQKIYPLWCGLVVTVSVHAVNLWDIVNMQFVKTLIKLHKGQTIESIHISDHKVKCIVSDPSQPNIKCIQLNLGP